ncbi:MAG: hypothetical protein PQJ44_05090, partial [Sphaerochaetaceae bacterium]|nr:hypothetical protein [Sphaerochaetaceae bacterium]
MFRNFTALYVEDEEKIKSIVTSIFGTMFKNFYTSSNGKEGLEQFLKYKDEIDVIITDINMPI